MPTVLPAVNLMRKLGLEPDPWQAEVLEAGHRYLLLNCCRQAGKSTAVAMLALLRAVWYSGSLVLLVSRTHRQSIELYRQVTDFYQRLKFPLASRQTVDELQLNNKSRIVALPCKAESIRGYSNVSLLIIDEAAQVPDDLYRAVRPMLAVSGGQLIALSTPWGRRGFFYDAWTAGRDDWARIEVSAERIGRIARDFLERERRALGEAVFRREYCCSFEALEGLVYPDLAKCVVPGPMTATGRKVGGIDFGVQNPFAAVWGTLDRDGVLWLSHEYYDRQKPLTLNVPHLPREVFWYADSSGANERAEMLLAGYNVRKSNKEICAGIAAVSARIHNGTLRILQGACPNLLAEAGMYRYKLDPGPNKAEEPVNEYNHALDALRYLIATLDGRGMVRRALDAVAAAPSAAPAQAPQPQPKRDRWLRYDNEALWTRIWP